MTRARLRDPWPLRLAARCLPREVRDEVLLELCEQHARIRERRGVLAASIWACRQPFAAVRARSTSNDTGSPFSFKEKRLPVSFTFLSRDVVVAGRRLAKAPVFAIFAISTLALGIGATTGIYSVVQAAMAPPAGVREVHEVVNITHFPGSSRGLSIPDLEDYRARQTLLDSVAAWRHVRLSLAAGGRSHTAFGELVSGQYFQSLGVQPGLGRLIQADDDAVTAQPVVVLGHTVWLRVFDGRPDAVGQTLSVNGQPFTVIGVAPREFGGLFNNGLTATAAWVPLSTATTFRYLGGERRLRDRGTQMVRVHGRLPSGVTLERVQAEVTAIAHQLDAEVPIHREGASPARRVQKRPWSVYRLADVKINPDVAPFVDGLAVAVMVAVGLVLLVACTNLANLMLARGSARRHEIAVRLALGATRWRLTCEGATETLLLAIAGGAAGIAVARLLLVSIGTELDLGGGTLVLEPQLDLGVFAVAAAATLLALVVAGVAPAWLASKGDARSALATDHPHAALPRWRGRRLLITAQVAVSVLLLALTALFVSQIRTASRHDSGFDLDRLAVAHVDFIDQRVDEPRTRQIVDAVLGQLAPRPGVEAAFVSSGLPIGAINRTGYITRPGTDSVGVTFVTATPEIFDALGVTIVSGRAFGGRDAAGTEAVAVVNETAARELFGAASALGQRLTVKRQDALGEPPQVAHERTIVGVASDSDAEVVGRRDMGVMYVPWSQHFDGRVAFSVRTDGDPADRLADLREAIAVAAPDLAVWQLGTATHIAGPSNLFGEISAGVTGVLGASGLILALVGLSGVLSHLVARRTREIGVRVALGATTAQARRLVLRDGLPPVAIGIAVGAGVAAIAQRAAQHFVPLMAPPLDLQALATLAVLLLAAGALACYLPARRASRIDPTVALRDL